ncbi:MAG: hypothetical protein AVDCRST_MAG87-2583, partial [uncultured Thermomicrobiales bacterium]
WSWSSRVCSHPGWWASGCSWRIRGLDHRSASGSAALRERPWRH